MMLFKRTRTIVQKASSSNTSEYGKIWYLSLFELLRKLYYQGGSSLDPDVPDPAKPVGLVCGKPQSGTTPRILGQTLERMY